MFDDISDLKKLWWDCLVLQVGQGSTVESAVSSANFSVDAYSAWVDGLVEDTPPEKKDYCGPLLEEHYWCESIIGEGTYCGNCPVTLEDLNEQAPVIDEKVLWEEPAEEKVTTTDTAGIHYAEDTVEKAVEDINFCNHCLERIEMWQKAGEMLRKQMRVDNEKAEELGKALESVITKAKLDEAIEQFEVAMSAYHLVSPKEALDLLDKSLKKTEDYYKK